MRLFLAAFAFATLGLVGPAAAEDCLCIGPDAFAEAISRAEAVSRAEAESIEAASFDHAWSVGEDRAVLATVVAESSLVAEAEAALESVDPLVARMLVERARRSGSQPVLWCVSPDDPRCQQDDSGESPHRVTLATGAPVAALVSTPRVPCAGCEEIVHSGIEETHPRGGIRVRLDRPPRT